MARWNQYRNALTEEALHWNDHLLHLLCTELDALDVLIKKWELKNMSELFTELEHERNKEEVDYEMILYQLRHYICNLGDRFLYGCEYSVLEAADCEYERTTKISRAMLVNILNCPGEYAIIDMYYK